MNGTEEYNSGLFDINSMIIPSHQILISKQLFLYLEKIKIKYPSTENWDRLEIHAQE
mgnify:CR=1 FL=1